MKRHPALEPFSRDHNVGLVLARQLIDAGDPAVQSQFAAVWAEEMEDHFDEEERLLGPLASEEDRGRLLAEHGSIRQAAALAASDGLTPAACRELGDRLDSHIRWEEREFFPAIESSTTEPTLASLAVATAVLEKHRRTSSSAPRRSELASKRPVFQSPAIDLGYLMETAVESGPQWGIESEQLNSTLLAWKQGEGFVAHVNDEVDVLLIMLKGSAEVRVGDAQFILASGQAALLPRHASRSLVALEDCSHLNVHQRRKALSPVSSTSFRDRTVPKRG